MWMRRDQKEKNVVLGEKWCVWGYWIEYEKLKDTLWAFPCQCQQEAEESHRHCSVVATADLQQNLPIVPRSVSLVAETRAKVKGGKATRRSQVPSWRGRPVRGKSHQKAQVSL